MTRHPLIKLVSKSAALAALHELAVLEQDTLAEVAGGKLQAKRILDWLENEADKAAANDQSLRACEAAGFVRPWMLTLVLVFVLGVLWGLGGMITGGM